MSIVPWLLLIPPPIPPPPAEMTVIAAEIRRTAPFDEFQLATSEEKALAQTVLSLIKLSYPESEQPNLVLKRLWTNRREELRGRALSCVDVSLARAFDREGLDGLRDVVRSNAGKRIYHLAMRETVDECFKQTVLEWITGGGIRGPLEWAAREKRWASIPEFIKATPLESYASELQSRCGRAAQGALTVRNGQIGILDQWMGSQLRGGRDKAFWCMTSLATLGGYELVVFRS